MPTLHPDSGPGPEPGQPDQHLLAAQGYLELEMYEDALEELAFAEANQELRSKVLSCRLEMFMKQERWEEALAAVEDLCELEPEEPQFCIHHAFILREVNQIERAKEILLEGPEALQKTGTFFYNLGCYEALLGNPEEAVDLVKKSFALSEHLREFAQTDPDLESVRDELSAT